MRLFFQIITLTCQRACFKLSYFRGVQIAMELKNKRIMATMYDQIYDVLKENIVNGSLQPGQRIQELEIAKDLHVSRSPVRSAINKLIGEGLLISTPNKHVWVREFSKKDILDAYEFRLVIEKYAIEKTIERLDEEIINQLEEFKKQLLANSQIENMKEYIEIDTKFHEYLIATSDNRVIFESLQKVSMLINPFRIFSLSSTKRFTESVTEHISIIDEIIAKNCDKATAICQKHLSLAKEEIIKHLKKQDVYELL